MSDHPAFAEDLREIVESFIVETREIFDDLHDDLLKLEHSEDRAALIDKIFRGVHTVKGTSSFLSLDQLHHLAHHYEDALSRLRNGRTSYQPWMMEVLFAAYDLMSGLLQQVVDRRIEPLALDDVVRGLKEISGVEVCGGRHLAPPSAPEPGRRFAAAADSVRHTPEGVSSIRRGLRRASSIRVDIDHLDDLIALVGELAVHRTHLAHVIKKLEGNSGIEREVADLVETTGRIESVTSELRTGVLKTRMVPFERVFAKFPRVAGDLGRSVDKSVEVVLRGTDTEVEKSLADQIGEPLLHLIRNAIDHGVEPRDVRTARGKPAQGRIVLDARQDDAFVAISVEDDGAGIDPNLIRRKAVQRRILTNEEAAKLDDDDAFELIWQPGFTTTDKVNRLSGRGVGLDVVRTAVSRLNGTVETKSVPGKFTRFTLRLPLTLATLRSLVIGCGGEIFALPLADVADIEVPPAAAPFHDVFDVNGQTDPPETIHLADALGLRRPMRAETFAALVQIHGKRYRLVFDDVLGREDIIVEPFDSRVVSTTGAAGSAVLADGRSVLVLDVDAVVKGTLERRRTGAPHGTPCRMIIPADGS